MSDIKNMSNKEMVSRIMKAATIISEHARRSPASYVIVNQEVSDYIRHLNILEKRKDKISRILNKINNKQK